MKFKRIMLFIVTLICTFIINIKGVFAFNIKVDKIKVDEVNGNVSYSDTNNTSDIVFSNAGDYITYKITLNNQDDIKYTIDSIKDNNDSEFIKVTYDYDKNIESNSNKDVYVTLKYDKKLVNRESVSISDITVTLNLIDNKGNKSSIDITPNTGDNIIKYIVIFILVLIVLLFSLILIKRRKGKKGLLLLLVLIPSIVLAKDKLTVDIKFSNITIKGEMLPYKISIKDSEGNIVEKILKYGDKIGELPTVSKDGYTFDSYVDQDNNKVDSDTLVTKDIILTPKFNTIKYSIRYNLNGGVATNKDEYTIEDEITLNNPIKEGYTFTGWTGSNGDNLQTRVTIKNETGSKEYTANYSANTNTKYTVVHKFEQLDGTYKEEKEHLEGTTDSSVTPSVVERTGYNIPKAITKTISGDGKTKIEYVYTLKEYELTIQDYEYIEEGNKSGSYKYGQELTLTAKAKENYTFSKWSNNETDNPLTIIITEDMTIKPIYSPIMYTITLNTNGGQPKDDIKMVMPSGTKVTSLPYAYKEDYIFDGWYTGLTDGIKLEVPYILTGDVTYYAHYIDPCNGFSKDSWDTILNNVENQTDYYAVGCKKKIDMDIDNDGTNETYTLRVSNNTIPSECSNDNFSQTACGFVVEFENVITSHTMNDVNSSVGGWRDSDMRTFIKTDIYNALPQHLKNAIMPTKVITGHSVNDENNYITLDNLYLLSLKEVNGNSTGDAGTDYTRVLDYYNISDTAKLRTARLKKLTSSTVNTYWWLRTSSSVMSNGFYLVGNNGTVGGLNDSIASHGISPAFRIGKAKKINTVTLDAGEGTLENKSIDVLERDSIDTLPTPVAPSGKVFDGWYTELTDGIKITEPYTPISNVTLYARYK